MAVNGANSTTNKTLDFYRAMDDSKGGKEFTSKMTKEIMQSQMQGSLRSFNSGKSLVNNFKV